MADLLIQGTNEMASLRPWRGDPIQVYPDGTLKEPPAPGSGKLMLSVPGLDLDSTLYAAEWWRRLSFTVLSSDLSSDTHTCKVAATDYNPNSGIGKVTASQVQNYLESWNAVVGAMGDNSVTFMVAILDAIKSAGFWPEIDRNGMTLTEVTYQQSTGGHRCRVNYSATAYEEKTLTDAIKQNGGVIVSTNTSTKLITFDITRVTVRDKFFEDVKRKAEVLLVKRRYHLSEAACQAIEAAGGWLTISEAQWNTYWRNKLAE